MVRDLTQHIRSGMYHSVSRRLHLSNVLIIIAANINPTLFPALTEWLTGLPDPSIDMHGFYVSKASFWDDFANLVDKVLARRYQWLSALAAGNDNDLSRFPFGESFDDLQTDAIFCDFLSAYVRACSYLISADVRLISRPRSEEIYPLPLLSHKHVRHLCTALRQEKTPVFHMMRKEYAADTQDMSNRLHEAFLAANGAQNLLRLTDEAFHHVPMTVQNGIAAFSAQLFSALGWAISDLPEGCDYINRSEFHRGVLLFFHKYSSDLLDLSRTTDSDVARDIVLFFSSLLSELCRWDEKIATQLVDESLDFGDPNSPTTSPPSGDMDNISDVDYRQDPVSFPALVANAWKLKVLRKYVIKGNMGMRVMSMATMDSALVEIWREYSNIDPTCKHPVMQYLADFLIHGQVVEYIISVDSHPQLIARSGNILGFLVVTHRWSDKQADAIWSTVSESPDPGVVTATMTMLRSIVGLMGPVDQLYLCQKLYELPVDHCTVDIFRFLRDLSGRLADKSPPIDYAMRGPNAKPWNVCIRMMIDTAPTGEVHQYVLNLHVEASDQLRALVHLLSDEERYAIYRKCGQLITENSTRATGSVRVVYILAIAGHAGDGFFFQQNEGLTRQILDELPLFVQKERTSLLQPSSCMMLALRYRLELLAFMVCRAGPAVPADLYEKIWNHTVGKDAASNEARDYAWTQFLQTLRIAPDNEFCKRLVSAYMPKMDPGHYTSALFDFVANYNFPTTRQRIITDKGEETVLKIPGDDLLWSMVLRSPQGTIEDRAARLLAARYVQIKDVEGVTLSEVEEAHVTLVEKCMQEIRLASKLLRNKSEEITSSMELDSAMADTSLQECELRLGRILFFQKLLLEYIRQKPELNRGRRADSKVDEADIPYGDAVTIRFQCGNERQSLMMGAEHTLDDLHKRLCHATGFTKINLFAKGKRLDVTARAHEKISAIDFGGQLLIQRAEGAEVTRPISGPMTGSSAFETTVVKYFDELFALMDSDDSTSHMV
jgi:ubiquitin carboxyl-terminal hydrolase 34